MKRTALVYVVVFVAVVGFLVSVKDISAGCFCWPQCDSGQSGVIYQYGDNAVCLSACHGLIKEYTNMTVCVVYVDPNDCDNCTVSGYSYSGGTWNIYEDCCPETACT